MSKFIKNFLAVCLCLTICFGYACGKTDDDSDSPEENIVLVAKSEEITIKKGGFAYAYFTLTIDGVEIKNSQIEFSSENSEIATVTSYGVISTKVKGISAGETNVVAKYGNKTAITKVIVEDEKAKDTAELSIGDDFVGLIVGAEKKLTAQAKKNGVVDESATLVWSSSDNKVATVSNGTITAVACGEATIKAEYGNVSDFVKVYVAEELTSNNVNSFDEKYVNIFGRSYTENNELKLHHASNAIEVGFIGSSLSVNLKTTALSYMRVYIDGKETEDRIQITSSKNSYSIASGLLDGYHMARIVKTTEMQEAVWTIFSFEADKFASVPEKSDLRIEFIGDSITAGYGSLGSSGASRTVHNSDSTRTYAYYTAQKLNADYSVVAWSGICVKAFYWVTDRNMLSLYPQLYAVGNDYSFGFNPNVVVLNLGTNDSGYLSNHPEYETQFSTDYKELLQLIRTKNPQAYIICLYGMMGTDEKIDNGIKTAVSSMNDSRIVYNPFGTIVENESGAAGHPSATAQNGWAEQLASYIKNIEGEI